MPKPSPPAPLPHRAREVCSVPSPWGEGQGEGDETYMNNPQKPSRVIRQRAKELRQPMTPPEARLWRILRNRRLGGFKFRRQHPIGHFIVDFYCMQVCLVVELDVPTHEDHV